MRKLLTWVPLTLGRLFLRLLKMGALAIVAATLIFLLDMLLVREEGRSGEPPTD